MSIIPNVFIPALSGILGPSITNILVSFLEPQLHQQLAKFGLVPLGFDTRERVSDILRDRHKFMESMIAFRGALNEDKPTSIIDAIFRFLNIPSVLSPEKKQQLLQSIKVSIFPLAAMYLGDDAFDDLYGSLGSKAILAKNIARVYAPYGVSGDKALELADHIYSVFESNPALKQGFSGREIGNIVEQATKAGLLAPTMDLSRFSRNLVSVLKLYRYAQDMVMEPLKPLRDELRALERQRALLEMEAGRAEGEGKGELLSALNNINSRIETIQRELAEKAQPEVVTRVVSELVARYPGRDLEDVLKYVSADIEMAKLYPFGYFQAGLSQLGGINLPAVTQEGTGYAQLDEKLKASAANSLVGSMLGATVRAVEKMGASGPLLELYNRLKSGQPIGRITVQQWLRMAKQSGLDGKTARTLLRQRNANAAAISRPEFLRALRIYQYHYDIAPILDRLRRRFGGNEELMKGALAEIAAKWGYSSIGALDAGDVMMIMHSPLVNEQAYKAMVSSLARGKMVVETQHVGRESPTARVVDVIKDVSRRGFDWKTDIGKVLNIISTTDTTQPYGKFWDFMEKEQENIERTGFVGQKNTSSFLKGLDL